jgi:hypothetical protein
MYLLKENNSLDNISDAPEDRELTLLDRCDRCNAQAFVIVNIKDSELLFCGHHYNKYEVALKNVAIRTSDQRFRINAKPSISANAE